MLNQKVLRQAAPLRLQVVEKIRSSIIEGRFLPGTRIKERQLIEMLDVSRTVIRESLQQLESENLIIIEPQKGPKVKEISLIEVAEIYQVRKALEVLAVQQFIQNENDRGYRMLKKAHEILVNAFDEDDPKGLYEAKNNFFKVIFERCGNNILKDLLEALSSQLWRLRIMGLSHPNRNPERQERSKNNLLALYNAITACDINRAESVMKIEVDDARDEACRLVSA